MVYSMKYNVETISKNAMNHRRAFKFIEIFASSFESLDVYNNKFHYFNKLIQDDKKY